MRAERADESNKPGEIPTAIAEDILNATVVVADLVPVGDHPNPNVMYELGLAHAMNKHVVIISDGTRTPFDVSVVRALALPSVSYLDVTRFKRKLKEAIEAAAAGERAGDAPQSVVSKLQDRYDTIERLSEEEMDSAIGEVMRFVYDLDDRVGAVEGGIARDPILGSLEMRNSIALVAAQNGVETHRLANEVTDLLGDLDGMRMTQSEFERLVRLVMHAKLLRK